MRLALAQFSPVLGDLEKNVKCLETLIARARKARADLLVLPELALTGYFLRDLVPEVGLMPASAVFRRIRRAARGLDVVFGYVEESPDHRFFNAVAYLAKGNVAHIHRKVYLPTYGMFDEKRYLAEGGGFRAFGTRFGRAGIGICEDLWHLSSGYVLFMDGAKFLLCPSASPSRGVAADGSHLASVQSWEELNRTYARFFGQFVIYANRVGFEDGVEFWGGSEVVGPSGKVLAKAPYHDEAFLVCDVDPGAVRRGRIATPLHRDEKLGLTLDELTRIKNEKSRRR